MQLVVNDPALSENVFVVGLVNGQVRAVWRRWRVCMRVAALTDVVLDVQPALLEDLIRMHRLHVVQKPSHPMRLIGSLLSGARGDCAARGRCGLFSRCHAVWCAQPTASAGPAPACRR
jgi:hypothetical protein